MCIFNKLLFSPEPVVEESEKYVEIASLFLKYKLDIITIPTDT